MLGTFRSDAQENSGSGMRMAVVDFQQALNGVEEGRAAKEQLKKEFEAKQKDIEKRKTELENLQKRIEGFQQRATSGLLKPEAIEEGRKLELEFRTKLETYTNLVQDSQREISQKEMEVTRGILNRIRDLVVEIGRQEGFSLVFEKNESGLLYASSYTDLTERVIQEFNKKTKPTKSRR
jgi:outer membrane protein